MGEQLPLLDLPGRPGVVLDAGTWAQVCDAAIEELAATGRDFRASDVIALGVPDAPHPSMWGPRFLAAKAAGLIERVGYSTSGRPTTHRSAVGLWRGVRRGA